MKICHWPLATLSKAMRWLSGDQTGDPELPLDVSCAALPPSASHTQIALGPDRSELNAIFRPSGEYRGD